MSFNIKDSNIVINAKLTTAGRKLLASGKLTFNKWGIGDSEMDYQFAEDNGFDLTKTITLRPKDKYPPLKYIIPPTENSVNSLRNISQIIPIEVRVRNSADERGFFTGNTSDGFTAKTTDSFVKQDNIVIPLSSATGSNTVQFRQGSGFTLKNEPAINEYVFISWTNPKLSGSTFNNGVIYNNIVTPNLWYKIENLSGTLSADTLTVTLDRNVPDFTSGVTFEARAIVYPSGDSITNFYGSGSTVEYWNESTLAFDSNCGISNDDVSVWNMNIIHTEDIIGKQTGYEGVESFGSTGYTGFKEYINKTFNDTTQKSIGIIHYSNNSISNFYGEQFYQNTAVLELPTIISHNSTGNTMGLTLSCGSSLKTIVTGTVNLNTHYYDLVDSDGNIYGKCFINLQLFVIEDEELIAALSYKSNRNWTLPELTNAGLTSGIVSTRPNVFSGTTEKLYVTYMFENTSGYSENISFGYSNTLPCQKYTTYTPDLNSSGGLSNNQVPQFNIDSNDLKFLTDSSSFSGGTGLTFNKFSILTQKVSTTTDRPVSTSWKKYDFTSKLNNYSTWSGTTIPSSAFDSQIYSIDNNIVTGGTTFDLHDIIDIPTTAQTDKLQFGDEVFFYGNIKTDIEATVFRTKFVLSLAFNEYNTSINPTWEDTTQNVHVTEVGIYSNQNGQDVLVAVGKLNYPFEKNNTQTRVIELSIDF